MVRALSQTLQHATRPKDSDTPSGLCRFDPEDESALYTLCTTRGVEKGSTSRRIRSIRGRLGEASATPQRAGDMAEFWERTQTTNDTRSPWNVVLGFSSGRKRSSATLVQVFSSLQSNAPKSWESPEHTVHWEVLAAGEPTGQQEKGRGGYSKSSAHCFHTDLQATQAAQSETTQRKLLSPSLREPG